MTEHTKTYNEHWMEEGRPEAEEPFPDKDYLAYVFACMDLGTFGFGKNHAT